MTTRRDRRSGNWLRPAEVIRTGICPEHGFLSDDFCGANEHGWVFKCKGVPPEQENSWFDISPIQPMKLPGRRSRSRGQSPIYS
jgi:hypothetical protein